MNAGAHALPPEPPGFRPAVGAGNVSRGRTELEVKVIEKIAGEVAREESASGGASGGFLGIGTHADMSARPKTSVELTGNVAALTIEVAMPYPAPLRQAAGHLRQRIMARVTELTGVEVRQVDIRILWLKSGRDAPARRVLL